MPASAFITLASSGASGKVRRTVRDRLPISGGGSLLDSLNKVKVIRCDEVQWRFLGLSLAGYNVLISLAMAAIAVWGLGRAKN